MLVNIPTKKLPDSVHVLTHQGVDGKICVIEASSTKGVAVYTCTYIYKNDSQQARELKKCYKIIEGLGYKYSGMGSLFTIR